MNNFIDLPVSLTSTVTLGIGYDSKTGTIMSRSALENIPVINNIQGTTQLYADYQEHSLILSKAMGFNIGVSVRQTIFAANGNLSIDCTTDINENELTWYLNFEKTIGSESIRDIPDIGSNYNKLDEDQFSRYFGDSYIDQIIKGHKIFILYKMTFRNEKEKSDFSASFSANIRSIASGASINTSIRDSTMLAIQSRGYTVSAYISGNGVTDNDLTKVFFADDPKQALQAYLNKNLLDSEAVTLRYKIERYPKTNMRELIQTDDFENDFFNAYKSLHSILNDVTSMLSQPDVPPDIVTKLTEIIERINSSLYNMKLIVVKIIDLAPLSRERQEKLIELRTTINSSPRQFDRSYFWKKVFSNDETLLNNERERAGYRSLVRRFKYLEGYDSYTITVDGTLDTDCERPTDHSAVLQNFYLLVNNQPMQPVISKTGFPQLIHYTANFPAPENGVADVCFQSYNSEPDLRDPGAHYGVYCKILLKKGLTITLTGNP